MSKQIPLNRIRLAFLGQQFVLRLFFYPLDTTFDTDTMAKCYYIFDQPAVKVILKNLLHKLAVNLYDIAG